MAEIAEDGPHVVTDEWVLGHAGILDVVNDGQVPGQPTFSGPDFLSDHTFSEAMPSERCPVLLALMIYRLMPRERIALRVVGLIVLTMMISVSGRDDDEPGIAPGAQSSSFPELVSPRFMTLEAAVDLCQQLSKRSVIPNLVHAVELRLMFICPPNSVGWIGVPHGPTTETFLAWISPH